MYEGEAEFTELAGMQRKRDGLPGHFQGAGQRHMEASQYLDQRRLPRAVLSDEAMHLARKNVHIYRIESRPTAEFHGQLAHVDEGPALVRDVHYAALRSFLPVTSYIEVSGRVNAARLSRHELVIPAGKPVAGPRPEAGDVVRSRTSSTAGRRRRRARQVPQTPETDRVGIAVRQVVGRRDAGLVDIALVHHAERYRLIDRRHAGQEPKCLVDVGKTDPSGVLGCVHGYDAAGPDVVQGERRAVEADHLHAAGLADGLYSRHGTGTHPVAFGIDVIDRGIGEQCRLDLALQPGVPLRNRNVDDLVGAARAVGAVLPLHRG